MDFRNGIRGIVFNVIFAWRWGNFYIDSYLRCTSSCYYICWKRASKMLVEYELKASRPTHNELLHVWFGATLFLIFMIGMGAMNLVLMFLPLVGVVSLYGYIYVRRSSPEEVIKIRDEKLIALSGGRIKYSVNVRDIKDIDVENYSEYNGVPWQKMIIFHLVNGDSFSLQYNDYKHNELIALKKVVASWSRE